MLPRGLVEYALWKSVSSSSVMALAPGVRDGVVGVLTVGEIALIEAVEGILRTSRDCWEVRTCGREGLTSATSVLFSLSDIENEASLASLAVARLRGVERPVPAGESLMLLFLRDLRG